MKRVELTAGRIGDLLRSQMRAVSVLVPVMAVYLEVAQVSALKQAVFGVDTLYLHHDLSS